jgi:hypothetical protein
MFQVVKMLKDKQLSFGTSTMEATRNGKLSTLTKLRKFKLRDLTVISVCIATDHST